MMFLVTLIAMSSGYALLRKNLNVAGQSMWAYHAPRGNARPTKELDNDGPDAVELHLAHLDYQPRSASHMGQ